MLPFVNMSNDPENQVFSGGVAVEILDDACAITFRARGHTRTAVTKNVSGIPGVPRGMTA